MYEDETYEALLERALNRVSNALDRREGSMVMNGVAPSIAELAQLYIALDFVFNATYAKTAPREFLIMRAADRNIAPKAATKAAFRAEFNVAVPDGARFSCNDLNFEIVEHLDDLDTETTFNYKAVCETPGAAANDYAGQLIPIDYIDGLTNAELVELIIPGEDEEDTEIFRQRYLDSFQSQAFGGNTADYTEKIKAMQGVGAVKIHPAWNADTSPAALIPNAEVQTWYESIIGGLSGAPAAWLAAVYGAALNKKLTVGGTVRAVVLASNFTPPSEELIEEIQTAVDPTENAGEGLGIAPIGHVVRIEGVTESSIDVELNLTYVAGWTWAAVESYVTATIDAYFSELAQSWADTENIVVRISQIESRILADCALMISDISGTRLNGTEENVTLDADSIPVRGVVSG